MSAVITLEELAGALGGQVSSTGGACVIVAGLYDGDDSPVTCFTDGSNANEPWDWDAELNVDSITLAEHTYPNAQTYLDGEPPHATVVRALSDDERDNLDLAPHQP